jgi:GTP-binding protein
MVITKRDEGGKLLEPFETLYVEVTEEHVGGILKSISARRGQMEDLSTHGRGTMIVSTIPTRGLIGFELELVNMTSGHGVMSHLFKEYAPHCGEITGRQQGTLVSMETGTATAYSIGNIGDRGRLFIEPGDEIYQGQIVGENPRADDMPVNPTKEKHVTNHRSATKGITEGLTPALRFSLERAIEYIAADELVEATPGTIRLRKRVLCKHERKRSSKKVEVTA